MTTGTAAPASGGFLSRQALLGVYLPALCFETAVGAVTPMIAVRAVQLGTSLAVAGVLAALLAVGQILGDAPAGALAARIGDRRALLVAAVLSTVTLAACALAGEPVLFGIAVLLTGATNSVYMLARQAYLTEITPPLYRARALSTLGGVGRIGVVIGPFLSSAVVHLTATRGVFWMAMAIVIIAGVVVALVPDVEGKRIIQDRAQRASLWRVTVDHRRVLNQLGIGMLLVGATRGARQVVLPLWSEHLGLAPAVTPLIFGLSGLLDAAVFYPAGKLMDRRGRLWVAVPSMAALGVTLLVLPLAHGVGLLAVVAMAMGLANGIGSGVVMTLGADVAPAAVRAQFLGVWRLFSDGGAAAGPLVVAAGAGLGSLAGGVLVMGGIGVAAAGVLQLTVPRWSVHANVRTRLAAGLTADGRPGAETRSSP
ncbi:MAG: MFS transporter [Micrococcales bacterium]|nr:MFS transporter [Micrococcales bacterium]